MASPASFAFYQRTLRLLHRHSLLSLFLGFLIRWRFSRAGLLVQMPGFPWVHVLNKGGHIEAANCTFFPGGPS